MSYVAVVIVREAQLLTVYFMMKGCLWLCINMSRALLYFLPEGKDKMDTHSLHWVVLFNDRWMNLGAVHCTSKLNRSGFLGWIWIETCWKQWKQSAIFIRHSCTHICNKIKEDGLKITFSYYTYRYHLKYLYSKIIFSPLVLFRAYFIVSFIFRMDFIRVRIAVPIMGTLGMSRKAYRTPVHQDTMHMDIKMYL